MITLDGLQWSDLHPLGADKSLDPDELLAAVATVGALGASTKLIGKEVVPAALKGAAAGVGAAAKRAVTNITPRKFALGVTGVGGLLGSMVVSAAAGKAAEDAGINSGWGSGMQGVFTYTAGNMQHVGGAGGKLNYATGNLVGGRNSLQNLARDSLKAVKSGKGNLSKVGSTIASNVQKTRASTAPLKKLRTGGRLVWEGGRATGSGVVNAFKGGKALGSGGKRLLSGAGAMGTGLLITGGIMGAANLAAMGATRVPVIGDKILGGLALGDTSLEEAQRLHDEFSTTELLGVNLPTVDPVTASAKTGGAIMDLEDRQNALFEASGGEEGHGDEFGDAAAFTANELYEGLKADSDAGVARKWSQNAIAGGVAAVGGTAVGAVETVSLGGQKLKQGGRRLKNWWDDL